MATQTRAAPRHEGQDAAEAYLTMPARERRTMQLWLAPSIVPITDPRFDAIDVDRAYQEARARHPKLPIYLLADEDVATPSEAIRIGSIAEAAPGPAAFVCAYHCDRRLSDAVRSVRSREESSFFTPPVYYPAGRYAHRDPVARRVLVEEGSTGVPKFNLDDFENLLQAIAMTRNVPGSFVEIGVYKGRSARTAVRYMEQAGIVRPVLLVDTYEGFAYEQAGRSADQRWAGTHTDTSLEGVREFVQGGVNVGYLQANIITDDLPAEHDPIAVCNIDVDMDDAVLAALQKVAPRIPVGGVMVVEDPGHTPALAGALAALDEFLESEAARGFVPVCMRSGQTLLIRAAM